MSATIIALNATSSVTIPIGQTLTITGSGLVQYGPDFPGRGAQGIDRRAAIGPFDRAVTVQLTATQTALSWYTVRGPLDPYGNEVVAADPSNNAITGDPAIAVANIARSRSDVMLLNGDSLIDRGFTTSDTIRASCWAHIASCRYGGQYFPVNGGVSGETSEQILARAPALIAANRPALIINGPISVNDLSNNFAPERSITALGSLFDLQLASGARVVISTVHDGTLASPMSNAASNYQRKWYRQVNAFIRSYAASRPVHLHDFAQGFNDPTAGGAKTGFSQAGDGRHLSFLGSVYQGIKLGDEFFSKLPRISPRNSARFDPRNLLAPFGAVVGNNATTVNGFLLGTGATGTGPNAWGYRRDSGDAVSTIDGTAGVTTNADRTVGGNKATVTVTAGGDGKGGGFAIPQNGATKRFSNARANTTAYTWGDRIALDSLRSATVFAPGTSAASAPDFTGLVAGDTVVDGTVTWMVTDRPKAGNKIRALFDLDATIASGSGGVFLWVAASDPAGTATFNSFGLGTTGSDFATFALYPDVSPWIAGSTLRHECTLPANIGEVGELSLRVFFVGANGSVCTINGYGASLEILS